MSPALPLKVAPSNDFPDALGHPLLLESLIESGAGLVSVSFNAVREGFGYLAVYENTFSQVVTKSMAKAGTSSVCTGSVTIPAGGVVGNATADGCLLEKGKKYKFYLYIEDSLSQIRFVTT